MSQHELPPVNTDIESSPRFSLAQAFNSMIGEGQLQVMTDVHHNFGRLIRAKVMRYLSADHHDDAVQKVYLKLIDTLGPSYVGQGFRNDRQAVAWLNRVTVTTCYDQLRGRQRTSLFEDSLDQKHPNLELTDRNQIEPETYVLQKEFAEQLLSGLKAEYKYCIALNALGYPPREIAKMLNKDVLRINTILHNTRDMIKRKFSPFDIASLSS